MSVAARAVPRALFIGLIFVAFAGLLIFASFARTGGDGTVPGPYGDTQDYDGIAFQILKGRGFGIDYTDAEWRKPYELHNDEGDYVELLARHTPFQYSTYRPPLLPYTLAAVYHVFGRNFLVWRIIEALLVALAVALVCDVAWRTFGSGVALIAAGIMFISQTYVRYVAVEALMTEPLAMAAAAVLLWTLVRFCETRRTGFAIAAGVAFALLSLARTFYVVWLPFIALLVWWLSGRRLKQVTWFVVLAIAIQVPWIVRNIRVTGELMPFGTQSGVAIYTGYSDLAVLHRGIWWMAPGDQPARAYVRELGRPCTACDSVQLAKYEMAGARVWVRQHAGMLPKLMYWKIANTVVFADEAGLIAPVFCFAIAAPLVWWRRRAFIRSDAAMTCALFVLLSVAVITATWSMGWRFMVPVEPVIAVFAAVPIASLIFGEATIGPAPAPD